MSRNRAVSVETAPASGVFRRVVIDAPTVELIDKLATFVQTNNVTTDAQLEAAIDGVTTQAALNNMVRTLLKGLLRVRQDDIK